MSNDNPFDPHDLDADQVTGYLIQQGLADNSVRAYRALYIRWHDYCVDRGLHPHAYNPIALRDWSQHHLHRSAAMAAQASATVGHLAALCGWPDDAAGCVLKPPRAMPRSKAIAPDKVRTVLQMARDVGGLQGLAVEIALYTAARRAEIAGMAWSGVDLEAGTITFDRPKVHDRHTVPLHPRLHKLLEDRWLPGETWIFPGRYGGHVAPGTVGNWIEGVGVKGGVHITSHVCRHIALTTINDVSKDLRAAQEIAGHRSPAQTAIYTKVTDRRMREAIDSLDEYEGPADPHKATDALDS